MRSGTPLDPPVRRHVRPDHLRSQGEPHPVRLQVCRGCCCGRPTRHPGVDHDGQLELLRTLVDRLPDVRMRTTGCLGPCSEANVIIVRHRDRAVWLGRILERDTVFAVIRWAARGGPGQAPMPAELVDHLIHPRDLEHLEIEPASTPT
jgi:(2Fe-2S) ferredoxin